MTHFPALPVWWELDGTQWNNGPDADGNRLLAQSVDGGPDSAPPRPDVEPRVNAPGAYRGPNYRGPKVVELTGKTESVSRVARQALADTLAALCSDPNTLYPLTQHEYGRTLTMWVELSDKVKVVPRRDGLTLDVNLQVIAPDGVRYTEDNPAQSTTLAAAAPGGVAWNGSPSVTGGLVYQDAAGSGGSLLLTNSGTAWAPIQFTIEPAPTVTNPTITAATTEAPRIAYNGALTTALEIDTGTGRVESAGVNLGGALSAADFFLVPPRSTLQVLFTADSGSASLTAINANAYE